MYHHFRGFLVAKSPTHVVVDCGGVGYFMHISLTTFGAISPLSADGNEEVFLYAHAVYREDAQVLYGFSTAEERDVFLLLLGVSGVGATTARMLLSSMLPSEVVQTIASGNSGRLQAVKGIGAKSAQRLVVDLRDKMARWSGANETMGSAASGGGDRMEAIAALEVLGFSRPAVEKAVASAIASQPEAGVEGWIKLALAAL
jgi:Holliday junction DNA helicase RuvA